MPERDDPFARFPLVAGLAEDRRRALREAGTTRRLARGATLFREGAPATALYGVLEGRVKLVRTSPEGRELLLHLAVPGDTFAEAALFAGTSYPATATALEDTTLFVLERTRLVGLLERSPDLALALLASMARWTRHLASRLEAMTLRRVEERLAAWLLSRTRPDGRPIPLEDARHLIAAQIGTAPEVLSRALRRLEDEGIARFEPTRAHVLDLARLRTLARTNEDLPTAPS